MATNQKPIKNPFPIFKYTMLIVILLALFGLYLKFKNSALIQNTVSSISKSVADQLHEDSNLQKDIKEIKEVLYEQVKDTTKIKDSIANANNPSYSVQYQKDLALILLTNRVIEILQTSYPFAGQIDLLISSTNNAEIKNSLAEILPYAIMGVATEDQLVQKYTNTLYKELYLAHLKNQPSLLDKLTYYVNYLVFIKQNNIKEDYTNIQYSLNEIEFNLKQGNLEKAHKVASKLEHHTPNTRLWLLDLEKRNKVNETLNLLRSNMNSLKSER